LDSTVLSGLLEEADPKVTIEQVRREWDRRGFSCDVWVDPPGQRWEDYVHTMDERVMVVEEQVGFEIAGIRQRRPPGETLVTRPAPCTRCATWAPLRPAGSMATSGGPGL